MIYIELLLSFIKIGVCTIGGGYAAIALIEDIVVNTNQWISMDDFIDIVAIAEMTPGPIAINSATFVGMKVAGFKGALIATAGFVLPSLIIVLTLAFFYYKYKNLKYVNGVLTALRPAIVSVIATASVSILSMSLFFDKSVGLNISNIDLVAVIVFILSLIVLRTLKKISPIILIIVGGAVGTAAYYILDKV